MSPSSARCNSFYTFNLASHSGLTYIFKINFISYLLQHSLCRDTHLNMPHRTSASVRLAFSIRFLRGALLGLPALGPPWREAGPPNHHDDKVDSDQEVVKKELSLSFILRPSASHPTTRFVPLRYSADRDTSLIRNSAPLGPYSSPMRSDLR